MVEKLVEITGSNEARKKRAEEGLRKLLGRDSKDAIAELDEAHEKLSAQKSRDRKKMGLGEEEEEVHSNSEEETLPEEADEKPAKKSAKATKAKADPIKKAVAAENKKAVKATVKKADKKKK